MNIIELKRKEYQDYELVFEYETDEHYAVIVSKTDIGYKLELKREKLKETLKKRFVENLFQRYLARPSVYAIEEDGKPAAIIEVDREFWNNRMKITDLVVLPGYRRKGYGKALVDKAKEIAKKESFRALFLDTHTCNTKAIDFYLAQGFDFCGIDTSFYSNTDVKRKEVWIELAYLFDDERSMEWNYETHKPNLLPK
ncbi:MAG TPA: GNAT family N-acetyltransferase [Clostridia bacterium]